ncbi:MAG TPA: hypothetical protein VIK53_09365 [Verrucomicrobiae bacterium]
MMPPEDNTDRTENALTGTADESRNEPTGLPWFRTWRDVYLFVFSCFVLYVVLLTIFSRAFS